MGAWEAGRTWGLEVGEGARGTCAPTQLASLCHSWVLTTCHLALTAQSMFQIPEFEQSEQEDSSPADRGLGPSPTEDRPPGRSKPWRTAPGHLGEAGHQQGQPAGSSHHGGAGAVETRSRHSSYPEGTEEDEGTEDEELSPFRGRSLSAPPILWAAQRYGRELRRMSDEFQGSFKKGLPRPKSAGTATQMRQSPSWKRFLQSWWYRNSGRGGPAPSQ
uniref:BCL2 associated agonist of cell death n=1 Tax=Sus scrofa TaxID=9823 RepID=A0A8D1BJZ9_PIG